MKIPYNILIQIKMSVRPYFKGFTLIFFFYNCRKQDYNTTFFKNLPNPLFVTPSRMLFSFLSCFGNDNASDRTVKHKKNRQVASAFSACLYGFYPSSVTERSSSATASLIASLLSGCTNDASAFSPA